MDLKIGDVEISVEYDYQPYERATLEYPGSSEYVVVERVFYNGVDITDFAYELDCMERIEEEVMKKIKNREW